MILSLKCYSSFLFLFTGKRYATVRERVNKRSAAVPERRLLEGGAGSGQDPKVSEGLRDGNVTYPLLMSIRRTLHTKA